MKSISSHNGTACARVCKIGFFLFFLLVASNGNASETKSPGEKVSLGGPFVSVEGHASILSNVANWSFLAGSFGYGVRGGYRFKNIGVFAQFEHNLWVATEFDREVVQGAFNIGVGGEVIYANGFVRTSLAIGPSILAFDTYLDKAGTTGFFVDFRPVGLRWAVHKYLVIGLDPIAFAFVAPVLDGIPLMYTQYRTALYLEAVF
jgi:hypothetical protein